MRTLLLILLFALWESPAEAPRPLVRPMTGAMYMAIGYLALIGVMRLWGGWAGRITSHRRLGKRVDRFNLGMGIARGLVPAWFAVCVYALGWRYGVEQALLRTLGLWSVTKLVTPAIAIGILPGLVAWAGLWWAQYPVDRAVREQNVLANLEAEMPVFAPSPFGSYLTNRVRMQVLFTIAPVLLILTLRDATTTALVLASRAGHLHRLYPLARGVDAAVDFVTIGLVLLFAPLVQRRILSTRRLPDGRLRGALADLLQRAGVRCREVLLWDTHNNVGNAAVMGVLPRVRYVMMSDLLLETMTDEQVQAVFAHELGHVHHHHLAWLIGVIGTGMCALSVGSMWALSHVPPISDAVDVGISVGATVAVIAVVWVAFGLLSRWFERQADVYAVRMMNQLRPGGDAIFAAALRRVGVVNNIPFTARNWTHGSMAKRVAFIARFTEDPTVAARFDRRGRRTRVLLWLLILASVTVIVLGIAHGAGTP